MYKLHILLNELKKFSLFPTLLAALRYNIIDRKMGSQDCLAPTIIANEHVKEAIMVLPASLYEDVLRRCIRAIPHDFIYPLHLSFLCGENIHCLYMI
jgi:hypothetical protein